MVDRFPDAQVTALDTSPGMIERAALDNAHPRIRYLVASVEDVPADGTFDAVVATHAFPYLPDKPGAVRHVRRLLHPGGRLLIVQGNTENAYDALFYVFVSMTVSRAEYLPTRTLRSMLREAGFTLGARRPLPRFPFIPSVYLVEGIR
jgi:ubiquinone/menaquinone biosynthesis C-methylase UbiE